MATTIKAMVSRNRNQDRDDRGVRKDSAKPYAEIAIIDTAPVEIDTETLFNTEEML